MVTGHCGVVYFNMEMSPLPGSCRELCRQWAVLSVLPILHLLSLPTWWNIYSGPLRRAATGSARGQCGRSAGERSLSHGCGCQEAEGVLVHAKYYFWAEPRCGNEPSGEQLHTPVCSTIHIICSWELGILIIQSLYIELGGAQLSAKI